jgi:DDE superfamily endonuclease
MGTAPAEPRATPKESTTIARSVPPDQLTTRADRPAPCTAAQPLWCTSSPCGRRVHTAPEAFGSTTPQRHCGLVKSGRGRPRSRSPSVSNRTITPTRLLRRRGPMHHAAHLAGACRIASQLLVLNVEKRTFSRLSRVDAQRPTADLADCARPRPGRRRGLVNLGGSLVTGMIGGSSAWRVAGGWAGGHRCAVVQGVAVSGGDHQPLRLVVLPVPAELAGGRGDDARAGRHGFPRNHPPVDRGVRSGLRKWVVPSSAAPVTSGTLTRCSSRSMGKTHYLWRAVDQAGKVLDILVQSRRNAPATKESFRGLLKGLRTANVITSGGKRTPAKLDLKAGARRQRRRIDQAC